MQCLHSLESLSGSHFLKRFGFVLSAFVANFCVWFLLQIIACMFLPFLIFPFVYFVPDEHHEREAASKESRKNLTKSVRTKSAREAGLELQKVEEQANGIPVTAADEEAKAGDSGEDIVDFIPGKDFPNDEKARCAERHSAIFTFNYLLFTELTCSDLGLEASVAESFYAC